MGWDSDRKRKGEEMQEEWCKRIKTGGMGVGDSISRWYCREGNWIEGGGDGDGVLMRTTSSVKLLKWVNWCHTHNTHNTHTHTHRSGATRRRRSSRGGGGGGQLILNPKMPSQDEVDNFFTLSETILHQQFLHKYNYDIVKDKPMDHGRYQWLQIQHPNPNPSSSSSSSSYSYPAPPG